MANGTGVTRGPFALSFGTSLNATDPNANGGQPSDRVQIQNESAFSLSILSSGAPYTIPAFQASTIPTLNGGQSITITPSQQPSVNASGSVVLVWLLPGQSSPMPDGILAAGSSSSTTGTLLSFSPSLPLNAGNPFTISSLDIPNGPQLVTLAIAISGSAGAVATVVATGLNSGIQYYSSSLTLTGPGFGFIGQAFTVNGNVDPTIQIEVLGSGSAGWSITAANATPTISNTVSSSDTVPYGGVYGVEVFPVGTTNPGSLLLTAPPPGYYWRLHSWSVPVALTAGNVRLQGPGTSNNLVFAAALPNVGAGQLGGLLVPTEVYAWANGTTPASVSVSLNYDLVLAPAIG